MPRKSGTFSTIGTKSIFLGFSCLLLAGLYLFKFLVFFRLFLSLVFLVCIFSTIEKETNKKNSELSRDVTDGKDFKQEIECHWQNKLEAVIAVASVCMAAESHLHCTKHHCLIDKNSKDMGAIWGGGTHRRLQTFALAGASGGERQKYGANLQIGGSGGMPPGKHFF